MPAKEPAMPHDTLPPEPATQRVIGWMIRDGFELTIVANAPGAQPSFSAP